MRHPHLNSKPVSRTYSNDLEDSTNPFDSSHVPSPSILRKRSTHSKSLSVPHAWAASPKYSGPSSNPFSRAPGHRMNDDDALHVPPPEGAGGDRLPPSITPKPELARPLLPREGVARAIALYNFTAVEPGDLSFSKGDVITITEKSDSTDDWNISSKFC